MEERLAAYYEKLAQASEGKKRQATVRTSLKSPGEVLAAMVVLRGLLHGEPTDKETALHALEVIRLAPGALELAHIYIKANII